MAVPDTAAALDRLKGTARDLVALLGPARLDRVRRSPAPGEWSPAEVVSHLADAELVYGVRLRMVVTADRPYLPAFDEGAWCRRLAELDADPKEVLARWRMLREANLRLLESLDPEEWRMSGVHAERGELTMAQLAEQLAGHDRAHLAQIRTGLADD